MELLGNQASVKTKRADYALSARQCRAARALIGCTQDEIAKLSGVSLRALQDFEGGNRRTNRSTRHALRATFEKMHIAFSFNPEGCFIQNNDLNADTPTKAISPVDKSAQANSSKALPAVQQSSTHAENAKPVDNSVDLRELHSLEAFQRAMAQMNWQETSRAFSDALSYDLPQSRHLAFYAATITRLWQLAFQVQNLSASQKDQCLKLAVRVREVANTRFADKADALKYFNRAMDEQFKRYKG